MSMQLDRLSSDELSSLVASKAGSEGMECGVTR
jgi:hypothetical protein